MIALAMFAAMLVGHYVADRTLQPGNLSGFKRLLDVRERWRWLAIHGAVHGLAVAIATGVPLLGALELVAHALIDRAKGRGWYGTAVDQGLHVACKVAWTAIAVGVL